MEENEKTNKDKVADGNQDKTKQTSVERDDKSLLFDHENASKKNMSTFTINTIARDISKNSKRNSTRNIKYTIYNIL